MSSSGQKLHKPRSMRSGFLETIGIIVGAAIIAYFVYFYKKAGVIPSELATPIYLVILLMGGYLVIRVFTTIVARVAEPKLGITRSTGIKNFLQIIGAVILLAAAAGLLGQNLTSWLIGAGFLGIVLGLAAQQVLGNIFAGFSLFTSRPFEIGDRITLANAVYSIISPSYPHESMVNGYTGIVQDIGIFYTRLILDEGIPAVFPNSVVIGSMVLNHSKVKERSVRVRVDVDKDVSFNQFKQELFESLKREISLINTENMGMEIIDVGASTYQAVIIVWAKTAFEEPIKTLVIQKAIEAQKKLAAPKKSGE